MNRIDWDDAMNHVRESFRSAHPLNACKVARPRGEQMSKTLDEYLHEIYVGKLVGSIVVSCHDMACIKSEQDARIAELTAEVASLRVALDKVSARAEQGRHEEDFEAIESIARNALKEGV